ncbi:MAG: hypothetical protein V1746_00440 [bacterium]
MTKRRKGSSRAKAWVALAMLAAVYAVLWLAGEAKAVAVSSYFPSLLESLKGLSAVYWAADYLPFAFVAASIGAQVVLFIIALFFVEPQQTPLEDPTHVVRLMGVSTPPMDHLSEALAVCPALDAEEIRQTLVSEGVSVKGS